jgi:hypothetical protein
VLRASTVLLVLRPRLSSTPLVSSKHLSNTSFELLPECFSRKGITQGRAIGARSSPFTFDPNEMSAKVRGGTTRGQALIKLLR